MMSTSLCLADSQVLIDGARWAFLHPLFNTHSIGVASTVYAEVQFYRDDCGTAHEINLEPFVASQQLTVVSATSGELQGLYSHGVSKRLGAGELESLALVRSRGMTFCTADRLAVAAMRNIGLVDKWTPLAELLESCEPPMPVPDPKYLRAAIENR